MIFGIPVLFFYLFAAWTGLIALLGIAIEGRRGAAEAPPED
jgi:hypothetical protein